MKGLYDDDILATIAAQQEAGAEPFQVLETLRCVGIDPETFMPLWPDVALALTVARRRLELHGQKQNEGRVVTSSEPQISLAPDGLACNPSEPPKARAGGSYLQEQVKT